MKWRAAYERIAAGCKQALRFDVIARIGYATRAAIYLVLGTLTLLTSGSRGTAGALNRIAALPGGAGIELAAAAGLICYGVFRLTGSLLNLAGHDARIAGYSRRTGHAISGLAYLALGVVGMKLALIGGDVGGGRVAAQAASIALAVPGGAMLVGAVGSGFLLAAAAQGWKAVSASFRDQMRDAVPRTAVWFGRTGLAARAVVLLIVGWHIATSALHSRSRRLGFGPALDDLHSIRWLYLVIATGLIVFGLFSLSMAWYRRIDRFNLLDRLADRIGS